jgi:hypothetical protein
MRSPWRSPVWSYFNRDRTGTRDRDRDRDRGCSNPGEGEGDEHCQEHCCKYIDRVMMISTVFQILSLCPAKTFTSMFVANLRYPDGLLPSRNRSTTWLHQMLSLVGTTVVPHTLLEAPWRGPVIGDCGVGRGRDLARATRLAPVGLALDKLTRGHEQRRQSTIPGKTLLLYSAWQRCQLSETSLDHQI